MMQRHGLSLEEVLQDLCSSGGLSGISGGYNDLRDVQAQADAGNEQAQLALDFLVAEVRRWLGAYLVELGGLDALVMTAGIGENRPAIREAICRGLESFGISLDPALNAACIGQEAIISTPESRVKIMVIPTNEELVVAREVKRFLEK
jgi:acetate kinase